MSQENWSAIDHFICDALLGPDPLLEATLADTMAAGLRAINVAPPQGKFLMLLAQIAGASRILEIGTLGGYSAIWMARALPEGGKLISLEYEPHNAAVAAKNVERADLADKVEIKVGAAIDTLPTLQGTFDLIFIDADKASYPAYFEQAIRLSRPGTVIVGDNTVRGGRVLNPGDNADDQGTRRFYDVVAAEPRVTATAIQTVGTKGWDGFLLARVER